MATMVANPVVKANTSGARSVRFALLAYALIWAILAIGLYTRSAWATWLWPMSDIRMTYVFLAAIAAAISAASLWHAVTGDLRGIEGIALDTTVTAAAIAVYSWLLVALDERDDLFWSAIISTAAAVAAGIWLRWAQSQRTEIGPPMPRFVRAAFAVFVVALAISGGMLLSRMNNAFAWDVQPETSTLMGVIFTGSCAYFLIGLIRGDWSSAGSQLAAFLAYDAVLLATYLAIALTGDGSDSASGSVYGSYATTSGESAVNIPNLVIYLTVLIGSALVAIWFLFVNRATRVKWTSLEPDAMG